MKSSAQRKLEAGIGNDSATGVAAEGLSSLGIMEVDLPIEAKIANLEATARARASFLKRHGRHAPSGSGGTDYRNRNNDALMAMRFKRRERERMGR